MRHCFQGRWTCSQVFKGLPFSVEMLPLWLKHMYSALSVLTWRPMQPAAHSRICSKDSAWAGKFARSTVIGVVRVCNSLCGVCRWLYSCCFVGCCFQDLFNMAHSILVQLPSSFFYTRLISVDVVHPYSSMDTSAAWKKLCFILLDRSDFHMTDSLSIADHAFASHELISFSVDEIVLPR